MDRKDRVHAALQLRFGLQFSDPFDKVAIAPVVQETYGRTKEDSFLSEIMVTRGI